MAFGSEIIFKLGGRIASSIRNAFTWVETRAATASKVLEKKFSFKDAFKGLLQGIGIGSVDAISQLVVRPFELGVERARNLLGLTSKLREITNNEISQTGGREADVRVKAREANDLNVDIENTEKLILDLNDNPLTFINQDSYNLLKESEHELVALKTRQAELQSALSIDEKNSARAVREFNKEQATLNLLQRADLKDSGEKAKLQIRLNGLRAQGLEIAKRDGRDSQQYLANLGAQLANIREQRLLSKKAAEERRSTLVSLGQTAAERPGNRGRSETERIAARGAESLRRAEDAAIQGGNPAFIARLTRQANRDLGTAGQRIAKATGQVDKDASLQGIKSELINANKTLSDIEKNLESVSVDSK